MSPTYGELAKLYPSRITVKGVVFRAATQDDLARHGADKPGVWAYLNERLYTILCITPSDWARNAKLTQRRDLIAAKVRSAHMLFEDLLARG